MRLRPPAIVSARVTRITLSAEYTLNAKDAKDAQEKLCKLADGGAARTSA